MKSLDRITNTYLSKKREDSSLGVRLVACESLNKHAITMLVSSALPLTKEAVTSFVYSSTDYALSPYSQSYREVSKNNDNYYASIIAYRLPFKMKLEDKANNTMIQISASSYLDSTVDEVWEKTEMEGKSVFFRKNDTPIESIMDTLMLASYNPDKYLMPRPVIKQGAFAEAFQINAKGEPNTLTGRIIDVIEDNVRFKVGKNVHTLKASAIITIAGSTADEAMEYLKKAYSNGNSAEYEKMIEEMFNGV